MDVEVARPSAIAAFSNRQHGGYLGEGQSDLRQWTPRMPVGVAGSQAGRNGWRRVGRNSECKRVLDPRDFGHARHVVVRQVDRLDANVCRVYLLGDPQPSVTSEGTAGGTAPHSGQRPGEARRS
jgi:hypothetical protein